MNVTINANEPIFTGNLIKTTEGAWLVPGLSDGSLAIIAENTGFELIIYPIRRAIFNVLSGKTRIKI